MAEKPDITRVTEGDSVTVISNGGSTEKHVIKLSGIGNTERYFLMREGADGKVSLVPFGPPANSTGGTWNAPNSLGYPGRYKFYLIDADDNDKPVGTSFKVTRK
jgi:hypothetical protein